MLPNDSIIKLIVPPNGSIVKEAGGSLTMYFKRIEDLREDNDYTQQYVADRLRVAREVYRRYEKGTRTIPVDLLIELAKLYKTSTDYILGLSDKK